MSKRVFAELDDREHILKRSAIYLGSKDKVLQTNYFLENDEIKYKEIEYVPGFIKIINEILDNSIDEALRTKFEFGNKIRISFDDKEGLITVEDNGRGIPVEENLSGKLIPIMCWGQAKAGENFDENEKQETIGLNGVGSYICNVFSTLFIGETSDGKNKLYVEFKNNASEFEYKTKKCEKQYTKVIFKPDLEKFNLDIKEVFCENSLYKQIIKHRLINLNICYPDISFYFDGKLIKSPNSKSLFSMFGEDYEYISNDNYMIGIFPNDEDTFRHYSYVNGLNVVNGGNHIDLISNEITNNIREKLSKKYKTIKPGEIKNKLFFVCYFKNFPNTKWDSQTKEKLTNSIKEIRDFLDDIDLEKFSNKILKNEKIIDPIVEVYKIKEEFKNRQEIDTLKKKKTKIKSDKYLPPINENHLIALNITEGECLDKNTEIFIMNENKNKNLNDVEIGDLVLTHNQKIKPILGKSTSIRDCFKIITESGKEIICSGNHRFFVYDTQKKVFKWKKLKNIDKSIDKLISNKLSNNIYLDNIKIEKINHKKYDVKIFNENSEIFSSFNHYFVVFNTELSIFERIQVKNINSDIHLIVMLKSHDSNINR